MMNGELLDGVCNRELLDGVCNPVRNVYFLVPKRREGLTESMRGKVQRFHFTPNVPGLHPNVMPTIVAQ
jgi:hypothetical protein